MPTNNDDRSDDERVNRAFEALRTIPIAEGTSPEAIASTIFAARHEANRPQRALTRRIDDMPWKYKAVMGTGTLAATIVLAFMLLVPGGKSLRWARRSKSCARPSGFPFRWNSIRPIRRAPGDEDARLAHGTR